MRRIARVLFILLTVHAWKPTTARPQAIAGDPRHDAIGGTFASIGIDPLWIDGESLTVALAALENGGPLVWTGGANGGTELYDIVVQAITSATGTQLSCAPNPDRDQVYIFHIAHWSNVGTATAPSSKLKSSAWYVYRYSKFRNSKEDPKLVKARLTGTGDPEIYGARRAFVLSLDVFDPATPGGIPQPGTLQGVFTSTLTQDKPENMTNLGTILGAFAGVASSAQMAAGNGPTYNIYAAGSCQEGTPQLPFELQITENAVSETQATVQSFTAAGGGGGASGKDKAAAPATGSANAAACTGNANSTPCSMTRTFKSKDHEFWDISGGLAVPGVRETTFAFATSNGVGKTTTSVTRHTEAYVFADLFPFGRVASKESWAPHVNVGIPVTTKSLYRPYFGLAENLTGWTGLQRKLSLPVAINITVGAVYMKTQEILGPLPTTQDSFTSALQWHRVWKPMFAIEIPVSSITSKLSGKSGSSGGKSK